MSEPVAASQVPAVRVKANIAPTLERLAVPITGLRPYGKNARQGDVGVICESLERLGQYRPIVVNKPTMEVLAGNHTLQAAIALGWQEIAATFVDVDEDTAARIVLIDNRSNDLATYDDYALVELLQSLPDFDATGFDGDDVDALLKMLEAPDLDELAKETGDPTDEDTWPTLRLVVPPVVAEAWKAHVETHLGDEVRALAVLLEVDADLLPDDDG